MQDRIEEVINQFCEGNCFTLYKEMGAHETNENGRAGVKFTLFAPSAKEVKLVGNFNNWQGEGYSLEKIHHRGFWQIFVPDVASYEVYKYMIRTSDDKIILKADPFGFFSETPPQTASMIYNLEGYNWGDQRWQNNKERGNIYHGPLNIYEVHLASWKKKEDGSNYNYRELAHMLGDYVKEMGYTHVEIMPITEHPFCGSWGYQTTGYYSLTSRYGNPKDFMYMVDYLHQQEIGVILDWVPGHFCKDDHGLRLFDGSTVFEYLDPHRAENYDWGTLNFDLGKPEVQSFLISNAMFWFEKYHIDGLRVDAVANMLYLDYGKKALEWKPNIYGGRENLEAIDFLMKLNREVFKAFPNALMIAEESTQWPLVSRPTYIGGLGFNLKWNMGWMNDTLKYMEMDSVHRKWHHNLLTFSLMYAYKENFLLPLSHDEVVHGKKSMLNKMPGDYWQKFANLRCYYGYMMAHPGKKLIFMGGEFGQFIEWRYYEELDWLLLDYEMHRNLREYVKALNHLYLKEASLWWEDFREEGFQWIDANNHNQSVIVFMRRNPEEEDFTIIICNFTPSVYHGYRIGVPIQRIYYEVFNSDERKYGGSGVINEGEFCAEEVSWNNQPYSILITIPPLAVSYFKVNNKSLSDNSEAQSK